MAQCYVVAGLGMSMALDRTMAAIMQLLFSEGQLPSAWIGGDDGSLLLFLRHNALNHPNSHHSPFQPHLSRIV